MIVRSLGYRTDLIFPAFDGEIIDRGDYLVIRSPVTPEFYWGNFLLFSQPPRQGDFEKWHRLFAREIGTPPDTKHLVFGWDSPEGEAGASLPFLQAGFRLDKFVVLTSNVPQAPAGYASQVTIRALGGQGDWAQAVENQVVCREPEFSEEDYRAFRTRQMDRYRRMAAAGLGDWFGAFDGLQLVADLGLFHDGEVGRYQEVQTHPAYRRRGIAGTLVYEAGRRALSRYGLETLVIVADQDSDAARLYRSVGFLETEKQMGLEWWPGMGTPANEGD